MNLPARDRASPARRVVVHAQHLLPRRRRRPLAVHERDGPALHARRPHRRRAPRPLPRLDRRRAPARAELPRDRQLAPRDHLLQPRRLRHAPRRAAARHEGHRAHRARTTARRPSASRRATSTSSSSPPTTSRRTTSDYFGKLALDDPIDFESVTLPYYARSRDLANAFGVDVATLEKANPALRPGVWRNSNFVPKGYTLRVPSGAVERPDRRGPRRGAERATAMRASRRAGPTSSAAATRSRKIARRHGVSTQRLASMNGIRRAQQHPRRPAPAAAEPRDDRPDGARAIVARGPSSRPKSRRRSAEAEERSRSRRVEPPKSRARGRGPGRSRAATPPKRRRARARAAHRPRRPRDRDLHRPPRRQPDPDRPAPTASPSRSSPR